MNYMDYSAPHCIVTIDGRRFDSYEGESLMSASVNLTTDKSGEGIVEFYDPDFKIIDSLLANGAKAASALFYFGWQLDVGSPFFLGDLARTEWNEQVTTLRFYDRSTRMKQQQKTGYHKKKTDWQILEDLAKRNGLEFDKKTRLPESQPFTSLVQAGLTDWQFAQKIAAQSGLLLYVQGEKLIAVEAGTTKLNDPVAALDFENDFTLLRGFGLSYRLPKHPRGRIKQATTRARGGGGKLIAGSSGDEKAEGVSQLIVRRDLPTVSVAGARQRSQARIGKRQEYALEHRLKTLPTFRRRINLRDTITLAGMGAFYSGDYIVTEITYSFAPGSLTCEMTVGGEIKGRRDTLK